MTLVSLLRIFHLMISEFNYDPHTSRYIITALLFILLFSCRNKEAEFTGFNGFAQGTTYSIVYENSGSHPVENVRAGVEKILQDFDMSLSLYEDSSILSRVNRNEPVTPDSFFVEVFIRSKEISLLTEGAFDVTVGPLVKAWGFGPDSQRNFSEAKRDSLLALVGMSKVEIRNGKVIKVDPAYHS